jgi:hypothetical protein
MTPEMTASRVTTRTSELWVREDGITHVVDLPNFIKTVKDAKEIMAVIVELNHGKPVPVLVDIRAGLGADRETRAYYAGKEILESTRALALLVESRLTRLMANLFISINQPAVPTRLFTSEDEAIAWLKTYL